MEIKENGMETCDFYCLQDILLLKLPGLCCLIDKLAVSVKSCKGVFSLVHAVETCSHILQTDSKFTDTKIRFPLTGICVCH